MFCRFARCFCVQYTCHEGFAFRCSSLTSAPWRSFARSAKRAVDLGTQLVNSIGRKVSLRVGRCCGCATLAIAGSRQTVARTPHTLMSPHMLSSRWLDAYWASHWQAFSCSVDVAAGECAAVAAEFEVVHCFGGHGSYFDQIFSSRSNILLQNSGSL